MTIVDFIENMAMTPESLPPDVDRAWVVTVATIVSTALAFLLTALRIYVRGWMIKLFGWDDFFNVLGMVSVNQFPLHMILLSWLEGGWNGQGRR